MENKSLPSPLALAKLVAAVSALPNARFVGFDYRAKESGELARHVLIVGASYENTLKQSIEKLAGILPSLSGVEAVAGVELATSLAKSLACLITGTVNGDYAKAGLYQSLCDGIKYHKIDGTLEIAGLSHSKVVIEKGEHKSVNSSPKTIAKNKLRKELPIGKFRTFALDAGAIENVRISGQEIAF